MDDDVHDHLRDLGADPGPGPDPVFADRLEADLRSQAYFASKGPAHAAGRSRLLLRPGLVLGVLLLVALTAAVVLTRGGDEADILVIENGLGATVTLPDGETIEGQTGLALPDGARIEIGADGFALVDGIVLSAGTIATVVDGVLELTEIPTPVVPTPPALPTSEPATPVDPPPTPTTGPDPTPTPGATATPELAATPAPAATPQPSPTPQQRPTATPAPERTPHERPSRTPTPRPTATETPQPTVVDVAPEIALAREHLGPQRAQLTWSVASPDGILGFQVRVRRGDTVRTAAVLRDPDARALTVERPERDRVFYRVLAIGRDGEVLARSNEVRVTSAAR